MIVISSSIRRILGTSALAACEAASGSLAFVPVHHLTQKEFAGGGRSRRTDEELVRRIRAQSDLAAAVGELDSVELRN